MKHVFRCGGAIALLVLLVTSAWAESTDIKPWVMNKLNETTYAMYTSTATVEYAGMFCCFRERGNATRSLPDAQIQEISAILDDLQENQDAILFGATSPRRVDPLHTRGSSTMDATINDGIRLGRATYVNEMTGRRCVVVTQGIVDDTMAVYLCIVNRPPGVPSLVPGRITSAVVGLQGIRDTLARFGQKLNDHEGRIRHLEDNLLTNDTIGLDFGIGGTWITISGDQYSGPVVSADIRYLDAVGQVFGGQSFNQTTATEWYDGQQIPKMSDNHFEGVTVAWAPLQRGHWGYYFRLGGTYLHAQRINVLNDSKEQAYMGGLIGSLALPLPIATPEIFGTIGYGRTIHSSETYGVPPTISEGQAIVIGVRLISGRR